MSFVYFNPYSGKSFFQFFLVFAERLSALLQGEIALKDLTSDEIQIGVLMGVGFSSALVGSFLVLRRMTMLANALSHTILFGIVLAYLITRHMTLVTPLSYGINLEAMLIASVVTGLLTTFLTEFLHKTLKLQEDASIGLVFTSLFAVGIILVTLFTRNAHIGTEVVMGNVDALQVEDLSLVWTIAAANLLLFFLFFKEYKVTTFDPGFAQAIGFSALFFNYLLMMQVSATSIGAFRAVGVLMVLAFMVGPALIARMLTRSLKKMLLVAVLVTLIVAICGVALSRHILSIYHLSLSTAGLTVCLITTSVLLTFLFAPERGWISRLVRRKVLNKRIG